MLIVIIIIIARYYNDGKLLIKVLYLYDKMRIYIIHSSENI